MLDVKIYENDKCERLKFPFFHEDLPLGEVIKTLENVIGAVCRKYNIYFKEGKLVFQPNEKLRDGLVLAGGI